MADDAGRLNQVFAETSFLYGSNAAFIEGLHEKWAADPGSVSAEWRAFFDQLKDNAAAVTASAQAGGWGRKGAAEPTEETGVFDGRWPEKPLGPKPDPKAAAAAAKPAPAATPATPATADVSAEAIRAAAHDSIRALMLIRAYRVRGHLQATLDPLGIEQPTDNPELTPEFYGFTAADLDRPIYLDGVLGLQTGSIRQVLDLLKRTYCGNIGIQYMHIAEPEEKSWLQQRFEGPDKFEANAFTKEGKIAILNKLIEAEGFERFLHKRFPGTKRFGLDGGEAMVPALEQVIKRGGSLGVDEIVIGMAHRGRLNTLAAVMGKPYKVIFHEFQGGSAVPSDIEGSGDVKYHMGASSDREFDGNTVHLSLTANPSHLEIVNPVVLGKARAKQAFDIREANAGKPESDWVLDRSKAMPLLIHGDAAFAGQGVVAECFALMGLKGYRTGGTMHFVINNQIGFTTSPRNSRSTPYPSDVALMVQAPIFHVNGDDPEAVVFAPKVATEYRQKFHKDVVVDMFCYRRFGHNEGDDPTFTQPVMYSKIRAQPSTREIYSKRLVEEGVLTQAEVDAELARFEAWLDEQFEAGKTFKAEKADWLDGQWQGLAAPKEEARGETGVPLAKLKDLGHRLTTIPNSIDMHKTLKRVIDGRREAIDSGENLDWATAESLAFASLVDEGFPVRLSGQDSVRGTFSQRHSGIVDQTTEDRYIPLNNLREGQAQFEVIDSALSEEAVLGFEYGYSLADPNTLVLWEAQFGDFVNGAQVVIDQFISSGERKWLRMSGLTMLLPHGYEGQGPEHSSARLERFLQQCAEDNMQVANCTTPANYFHILRRQMHRSFRKPLILMTPKSLLRHKKAVSSLSELAEGSSFHRLLHDDAQTRPEVAGIKIKADKDIRRVILCSGKVYYDLLDAREKKAKAGEKGADDVYILRLEQFYPWPIQSLRKELARFPKAEVVWCQEEPKNMGGWTFVDPWLELTLDKLDVASKRARYVGRPGSASTAAGLMSRHLKELEAFTTEAFA
ncbi:2-oxoglutarate dehydrogenase E1 component [Brevundimonas sp.]|uniref:2-oxoglutarate dehydrogenase E1 component n=2 Tax=Brevundimonas sp. TaxID=1871086 RepID=UPI004033E44F